LYEHPCPDLISLHNESLHGFRFKNLIVLFNLLTLRQHKNFQQQHPNNTRFSAIWRNIGYHLGWNKQSAVKTSAIETLTYWVLIKLYIAIRGRSSQ